MGGSTVPLRGVAFFLAMEWAINSFLSQEQKEFHIFFLNCYTINALKILCEVCSFMKNN